MTIGIHEKQDVAGFIKFKSEDVLNINFIKTSVQKYYQDVKPKEVHRKFIVVDVYDEEICSGYANDEGVVLFNI